MTERGKSQAAPSVAATSPHVVVDLNRCQGYAQCCFLAPRVFWPHGEEALLFGRSLPHSRLSAEIVTELNW